MDQPQVRTPGAQEYQVEAIEGGASRIRKPRQWLRFTLRRLDDGRVLQVKLRLTANVGDTVQLDDRMIQVG
ncbi:MAG TPA: hypothetical protein VG457_00130, partial [Planctomycetota bacterium]|nr:hypothetical protein [Planctomycetota bacterium]